MSNARCDSEQDRRNLALNSAEMGIWDWDLLIGEMWWDERMHALFGIAPGDYQGGYQDFLALIDQEDRERIRGKFAYAIAKAAAVDIEFRVAWPSDGSRHVVRLRGRVHGQNDTKSARLIGVAWEITERRHPDMTLDRERSLLTTLMDNLPYKFYFKDLTSRFVAISRASASLHGKEPAELVGLTDRDLFSSEHAERALADEREIIRTGKPLIDYEEKETWSDRADTWVSTTKMAWRDAHGNVIGTFGISQDITEKKRAAELAAIRVWGKYAPVDLVRRLYREKSEPALGGELMEISIMFSDIKGFTTFSEQLDPSQLSDMLGLYLETLSHIIQRDTLGTIDKYIGDAIMTIWNAPEPVRNHPQMACLAAVRCREAAQSLAQAPEWRGFPSFETRFGLHCAKALVGHFGARDRMNYTAIGDAINVASRLEGLNKRYGSSIIASKTIVDRANEAFDFRLLDVVAVKGKSNPITIYELLGTKGALDHCRGAVSAYETAFKEYLAGNFESALVLLRENTGDPPSSVLVERCKAFLKEPPAEDWGGIYVWASEIGSWVVMNLFITPTTAKQGMVSLAPQQRQNEILCRVFVSPKTSRIVDYDSEHAQRGPSTQHRAPSGCPLLNEPEPKVVE
jgi:PAS domain S-box-containing protein